MNEVEFSREEYEDEDFDEFDAFIGFLRDKQEREGAKAYIVDPHRIEAMRFSCAAINRVLRETGCKAKVECGQSKLSPDMGYVNVEAKAIDIENMEWFARAAEFADNTEVYPLVNGMVRMTFGFNRVLKNI